jgi:hypothetical protein
MRPSIKQYFPLTAAYLCQDCESVSDSAIACPACASSVLMSLAGVLDRNDEVSMPIPTPWQNAAAMAA